MVRKRKNSNNSGGGGGHPQGGGGGRQGASKKKQKQSFHKILRDRVAELEALDEFRSSLELCEVLRSRFPEYKRQGSGPFEAKVGQIVQQLVEERAQLEMDEAAMHSASNALNRQVVRSYSQAAATAKKRQKAEEQEADTVAPPSVRYEDVGGIEHCIQDIRELIERPLIHPEIYTHLGVAPPTGILLHGPPGTGKSLLAHAIAGELQVPFLKVSAPELVSGYSGESEKRVRDLFADAANRAPCIVFIDEIDAVTPKRETAAREMERRIVAQFLTCLDNLATLESPVIVLGASNRVDAMDPALRRAGRFDREISLGIPDAKARARILAVLSKRLRLDGLFDYDDLAKRTPGFVGADLVALTKEAAVVAVNRIFSGLENETSGGDAVAPMDDTMSPAERSAHLRESQLASRQAVSVRLRDKQDQLTDEELAPLFITMQDFLDALPKVQPSAQREGFATVPDVSWEAVGALDDIRAELQMAIVNPIRDPESYQALGLSSPAGVLLYGPPGCGKTLLARAVSNECGANFISVKGPELLNKYVGESERAVRQVFQRARASSPCVVFFDELDALVPKRGGDTNSTSSDRVVNQLLTELDGLVARKDVFVIGATNRPDIIDAAMMRPGRLDKILYVPLPSNKDRVRILQTLTKFKPRLAAQVNLEAIGMDPRTDGFSGADLASLVREAAMGALKDSFSRSEKIPSDQLCVKAEHFEAALTRCTPSVSPKDAARYEELRKNH